VEFNLSAVAREGIGKEKVAKLRQQGQIPAVIYGEGKNPQHLSVSAHDLGILILKGGASKLITLKIGDGKSAEKVLIKEYQRHPVKGSFLHVDFLRVAMDQLIRVKVAVHIINEGKRIYDGAILEVVRHELELECLPGSIPNRIDLDVGQLAMGAGIHVKDLVFPEGVKVLVAPEEIVVHAVAPKAAPVEEVVEVVETAEPEVIGEKKEEE
jgi:large subunit ribosomal protein L25